MVIVPVQLYNLNKCETNLQIKHHIYKQNSNQQQQFRVTAYIHLNLDYCLLCH